jgi:ribosomal protein L37AE/L43A
MNNAEAAQERENIMAGLYGPKAQAALMAHPEALVDAEHAVYQCGACGKLEGRLAVKITAPVRMPIRQHCDCGAVMHRIRAGEEMLCPSCGKPLGEDAVMAGVKWD